MVGYVTIACNSQVYQNKIKARQNRDFKITITSLSDQRSVYNVHESK